MPPAFKDHFSGHAADYAGNRPQYPAALFEWIASLTARRDVALDVATGNGQAARGLAAHFERVLASDASAGQIASRLDHQRVGYFVSLAERLPLPAGSCDALTVAQAVHWFDFERFHAEVRRVVRPGGVVVAWAYGKFQIAPAIDAVVEHFYEDVVGEYWPPERHYVEAGYGTVPFPHARVSAPHFDMEVRWTLTQVLGYIATWSAVRRYAQARGVDPMPQLARELEGAWGEPGAARQVHWPFALLAGRV